MGGKRDHRRLIGYGAVLVVHLHVPDQEDQKPDEGNHGQQSGNSSEHDHGEFKVCARHCNGGCGDIIRRA